ncbi:unnamed protein product, partial [Symbiodinium microadriaticum]
MTKRHPCPAAFWSQRLRCCSAAKRLPRRSSTAPPLDHSVHAGLRVAGRPDCAVQEVQGLETANAILNQRAASQKAVTGGDAGWEGSSGVFASDEDGYVQKHEAFGFGLIEDASPASPSASEATVVAQDRPTASAKPSSQGNDDAPAHDQKKEAETNEKINLVLTTLTGRILETRVHKYISLAYFTQNAT